MRKRQKLVAVLLFTTAPLVAGCITDDDPHMQPQQLDEVALIDLRSELLETEPPQALERMDHFRPLCDEQGYPLVGNVASKSIGLQPSQFCTEVRG